MRGRPEGTIGSLSARGTGVFEKMGAYLRGGHVVQEYYRVEFEVRWAVMQSSKALSSLEKDEIVT
jgi:hypothetical protein